MPHRRTILIADGKPNTVPDVTVVMGELGYEVVAVSNALFQAMAVRYKPRAIVFGTGLPAGGPVSVLRRLRASVHTASIPAIALVANEEEKLTLLSAGADECMQEPASAADLLVTLRKHLATPRIVASASDEVLSDPDRLSALGNTKLMDTDPDDALDVLTRLAARILDAPVAVVSLVDDRRQFFKSQVGLPHPWDKLRETPVSGSFCQWVVSGKEELVISDARSHPVLKMNSAITELGTVAYAGAPLSAVMGQSIGSFCVVDGKPRSWDEDQMTALRHLGEMVDAHVSLYTPIKQELSAEAHEQQVRAATRAACRGFLAAARLLSSDHLPITNNDRREIVGMIEVHSHRLSKITTEQSAVQEKALAAGWAT